MLRILSLICASLLLVTAAHAGEASRVSNATYVAAPGAADAFFQRVASKPCCSNDGEYFYSSSSTCRKFGGRVVPQDYCERQYYGDDGYDGGGPSYGGKPCCYNNGQFFNATPKTCRRYGGRVASQERCNRYYDQQWGDDNYAPNAEKPCCYNNGRYYNSTPKTCQKYGGRVVHQRYCTRQYDDR